MVIQILKSKRDNSLFFQKFHASKVVFYLNFYQQRLRLHLLDASDDNVVMLSIFYPKPQRYDVYVADTFIPPTNIDNDKWPDNFQLLPEDDSFMPSLSDVRNVMSLYDFCILLGNYLATNYVFLHIKNNLMSLNEYDETFTVDQLFFYRM